jgi:hypothetical protein
MVSRELLLDRHLIHDDVAGDPVPAVEEIIDVQPKSRQVEPLT